VTSGWEINAAWATLDRVRLVGLVLAVLVVGCVRTQTETCGDRVCPDGTTCAAYRDLTLCVSPEQTAACATLEDGDACTAGAIAGFCHDGACLPVGCGNGRIDDPLFATDEECDDGNRISHDGCSSTCRDEVVRVDVLSPFHLDPITDTAIATDSSSRTPLLFGGAQYGIPGGSTTWAFAEQRWHRLPTRKGPSGRRSHATAFDHRRQRLVLFGGTNTDARFSDTWEFDGTAWHVRDPAHTPPPRRNHAMAYDSIRGVTVMFGGRTFGELGDTWEWDGTDWTERDDAMRVITRTHQSMAFDAARGVMVMVVESNQEGVLTYELADDGWQLVAAADRGPPPGLDSPIAFDPGSRRILRPGATLSAWDGQAWTSLHADDPDRREAALAATADGRMLRVGGSQSDLGLETPITQEWTGTSWNAVDPPPSSVEPVAPGLCDDFDAVYDQKRQRVVFFGGTRPVSVSDTWELGPTGWKRIALVGPAPRAGHAMAYDLERGETVLFGGNVVGDHATWTWNGTAWTDRGVVAGLDTREFATMGYDPERKVVVLFGGLEMRGFLGDTWEWDGNTWTKIDPLDKPPSRADAALAYDPIRKKLIMFGGRGRDQQTGVPTVFGDTWSWDGATWVRLEPAAVPSSRFGHGLAWDPTRARLQLYGGSNDTTIFNDPAARDVWEWDGTTWVGVDLVAPVGASRLSTTQGFANGTLVIAKGALYIEATRIEWNADTAYETCTQSDRDRDGLVGCRDPDCWATCTPLCFPGTTCSAGPRCGDGLCTEQCSTCPEDCGACPAVCGDGTCSVGEDCVGDCTP
jgi:cysteine-rich repeat protein